MLAAVPLLGLLAFLNRSPRDVGVAAEAPYLTVFLLDGLSESVFRAELLAGRLPSIARMAARGALIDHGISSFPSMTAYGFHPFITGQDAAHSGVLGLRWFDRRRTAGNLRTYVGFTQDLINGDRALRPATIYERVGGQHTLSVNTYANRGVRESVRLGWSFGLAKYRDVFGPLRALAAVPLLGGSMAPDWETAETRAVQRATSDLARWPKVQWITLSSLDGYQHVHGTDARYASLLRHADALIGRYQEASARLGQEPYRVYAVVSDHGVADARVNVDLRSVMQECCGLRVVRDTATRFRKSLTVPLSEYDPDDVVLAVNGNMMNYLYVRDPAAPPGQQWRRPLGEAQLSRYGARRVDMIAGLLKAAGVELVIVRGDAPGRFVVRSAAGRGVIAGEARALSYQSEGADPLGLAARGLADGAARTPAQWLAATHDGAYPDAVHRIAALMGNADAGDLVVTSAPGYDLGAGYELLVGNYRGGHGGLRADQIRVPYVLAGPGVVAGARIPAARAEDVGVTLMALLGLAPEAEADGELLRGAVLPARTGQAR